MQQHWNSSLPHTFLKFSTFTLQNVSVDGSPAPSEQPPAVISHMLPDALPRLGQAPTTPSASLGPAAAAAVWGLPTEGRQQMGQAAMRPLRGAHSMRGRGVDEAGNLKAASLTVVAGVVAVLEQAGSGLVGGMELDQLTHHLTNASSVKTG